VDVLGHLGCLLVVVKMPLPTPPRIPPRRGVTVSAGSARDDETVTLVLLAVAAGVAIGFARGGGLAGIVQLRLHRHRLLLTALGIYVLGVLGGWVWEPLLAILAALAWLTIAFYAWVNRKVRGAALIAAGLAANGLVLLLNGAVPVSFSAAAEAGADPSTFVGHVGHEPSGPDTLLPWLGETVPVAFPPRPEVVSPGDVAVAAGLSVVIALGMAGATRRVAVSAGTPEYGDKPSAPPAERETMGADPELRRSVVS
jgi:hypothetical protein